MSTCKSCGKKILWCFTANGTRMPVDDRDAPDGNMFILGDHPRVAVMTSSALGRAVLEEYPLKRFHKSHFVTCPNAKEHRRAR